MRAAEIARLLPELYQDALEPGSVLDGLLAVMEAMHAPDEATLAAVDSLFDPRRAPDAFVAMLAQWLALGPYLEREGAEQRRVAVRPGPLRDLVSIAAEAARLRGTEQTLRLLLERATGVPGFAVIENPPDGAGRPMPFHIRVAAPAKAAGQIELVRRIVAGERPAWVTFDIVQMAAGPEVRNRDDPSP